MHLNKTRAAIVARRLLALLLILSAFAAVPAGAQTKAGRYEKDIEAFEAADHAQFPPADAALFLGSSSIRFWTTLAEDFPEIPTIRRGFGGSELSDSVLYADRIAIPYKPRIVVVYAGGNDLNAGKSVATVVGDFEALAAKIHAALPATTVIYVSMNPTIARWSEDDKVRETNRQIAEFTKSKPGLAYIDTYSGLLGADGKPQAALLRVDGLHLNRQGYRKWTELMKARVLELYRGAGR